ncbi:MAG: hypothetical protein ACTSWY_08820, partial [Promethearchaeota archaeon]
KSENGTWEKPSERQGKKIKLNLGELIMIQKVLAGINERWSTVHKFNDEQTSISFNTDKNDRKQIWINVDSYRKNLREPETDLLLMLVQHIIKEKIEHATGLQKQGNNGSQIPKITRKEPSNQIMNTPNKINNAISEVEIREKRIMKEKRIMDDEIKNIKVKNTGRYQNEPNDFSTVTGAVQRETEKAVLILFSDKNEPNWVPKSIIKSQFNNSAESQKFLIAKWFLDKEVL